MKIGFDISQTGNRKAGCGYFADSLIQMLTHMDRGNEYILYPHFGTTFWDPKAEHTTREIDLPHVSRKRIGRDYAKAMAFWSEPPDDAERRLGNPDIIHCNNYFCPKGIHKAKVVYTLYDLNFLEYPKLTTEENRYKCFMGVFDAATSADFIVSISDYSKKTFLRTFPHYPRDRIRVVPLGSRFTSEQQGEKRLPVMKALRRGRFWLSVGTLEPRKNLRRLLRAFAVYAAQTEDAYPLALAGGKGWLEEDLDVYIRDLGLSKKVHILGYVHDSELIWLYQNCFGFVYPSLYEGFGLPVLEAMASGAAVITSNCTSLPEIAGDWVHYVDPFNERDLTDALLKLGSDNDYRETLKNGAPIRAKHFSWERSAAEVLDAYSQVLALPKLTIAKGKGPIGDI